MSWKTFNPKQKLDYSKTMFLRMLEHGTKSGLNPFQPDYTIGIAEPLWTKEGLSHFLAQTGLVLQNPYTGYSRKTDSIPYSKENVTIALLPQYRRAVAAELRAALLKTDDCKQVAQWLNENHCPVNSEHVWTSWQVRSTADVWHCWPVKRESI